MFKELFTIKYNNKDFLILVNEKHRFTFMEIKDKKLVYSDIEDFKQLFVIFNVDNGIYAKKSLGRRLDEKVNYKGLLLSFLYSLSLSIPIGLDVDFLINKENSLIVKYVSEQQENNYIRFKSVTDLNAYLGYQDITIEEVFEAIDNNETFNDRQREIVKAIITEKVRINPDIDLRIIYENMKDLTIEYKSESELLKMYNMPMSGCYCVWDNKIYLTSDDDQLFAHEISHAMHGYYRTINGKTIVYGPGDSSFHECITNREGALGIENYKEGKAQDERMYSFLLIHADKFNLSVYDEYGINPLFEELKEKYPDVDIDFIMEFFNGEHTARTRLDIENISMFDSDYLLDQAFEMTLESIDEDDIFKALYDFYELLDYKKEYCEKYAEKYYKYLLDNNFIGTQEYEFITKFDHLVLKDKEFYLGTSDNKYFNIELDLLDENDDCIIVPITDEMKNRIINDYGKGIFVFDDEYTSSLIKDGSLLNSRTANGICNYSKEDIVDVIDEIFFKMLEDCETLEEIQEQYLLFIEKYETLLITESNYMVVLRDAIDHDLYFKHYRDFCVEKGLTTEKNMALTENINYIVEYNGVYYLVKSISDRKNNFDLINDSNSMFNQETNIVRSTAVEIIYLDEKGEEKQLSISKDVFVSHKVKDEGKLVIQTYLENHNSDELSQDFIKNLMEECKVLNPELYTNAFTFKSGEVIYDGVLDDSFYVVFGKNENNEITYQISKDNNVIYESCDNFVPMTSPIRYKTFIDAAYLLDTDYYLDDIFSDYGYNHAFYILESIMKDVKVTLEDYEEAVPITDENDQIINYKYIPHTRTIIDFIKPVVVNIDGQNYYARDIGVFGDPEDDILYITYPDGSKEQIIKTEDIENYNKLYGGLYYYQCLEDYVDHNNLVPDETGIIYITRDEFLKMVLGELNNEIDDAMTR